MNEDDQPFDEWHWYYVPVFFLALIVTLLAGPFVWAAKRIRGMIL